MPESESVLIGGGTGSYCFAHLYCFVLVVILVSVVVVVSDTRERRSKCGVRKRYLSPRHFAHRFPRSYCPPPKSKKVHAKAVPLCEKGVRGSHVAASLVRRRVRLCLKRNDGLSAKDAQDSGQDLPAEFPYRRRRGEPKICSLVRAGSGKTTKACQSHIAKLIRGLLTKATSTWCSGRRYRTQRRIRHRGWCTDGGEGGKTVRLV